MKHAAASGGDALVDALVPGTIVEYDDGKHTNANLIGVVEEVATKAKASKGALVAIAGADGEHYSVPTKSIHYVAAGNVDLLNEEDGIALVAEFAAAAAEPPEEALGIGPELLELCWEETVAAVASEAAAAAAAVEEGGSAQAPRIARVVPQDLLALVDESLQASPVALYRAFRLLQSATGALFFTTLKEHGRAASWKAKTPEQCEKAKSAFCIEEEDPEFCPT